MDKIYYIFFILCLIYLIFKWRSKKGFWSNQPVFHYHDIMFWLYPRGIIQHDILEKTKYYSDLVSTYTIENIPKTELEQYIDLIKKHYIIDNELSYNSPRENIYAYMDHSGYTSLFKQERTVANKEKNRVSIIHTIISGISSRPITLYHNQKIIPFSYYTDFLCTHNKYRKQNITPKMIYTHVCDIMIKNNHPCLYLFKREGEYSPFVPIISSYSFIYNIKYILHKNNKMNLLTINKSNLYYLFEKIKELKNEFSFLAYNSYTHILRLIESNNLHCYVLIHQDKSLQAFYVFTNNYMKHKNENIIELSLSYKNENCSNNDFYCGFINCIKNIQVNNLTYLVVDNIAHNDKIIQHMEYKHEERTPISYYIYNYASYTLEPKNCFILV